MFLRLGISIAVYALSLPGLFLMFQLISEELRHPKETSIFVFVFLIAWLAHAAMTIAWIDRIKLRRIWPIVGTIAGVAGLLGPLLIPIHSDLFDAEIFAQGIVQLLKLELMLFGPAILFAINLVYFHTRSKESTSISAVA